MPNILSHGHMLVLGFGSLVCGGWSLLLNSGEGQAAYGDEPQTPQQETGARASQSAIPMPIVRPQPNHGAMPTASPPPNAPSSIKSG